MIEVSQRLAVGLTTAIMLAGSVVGLVGAGISPAMPDIIISCQPWCL